MSAFSYVDSSADPDRLIAYLEQVGLTAMRHYMAQTHARRDAVRAVLDIGCGVGRDLAALTAAEVTAVGVDPSRHMLEAARPRVHVPLASASGEHLPFADNVFAGCSIQRVLMHVERPAVVLSEAVRCVQANGVLTVFEPDWSMLAVNGSPVPMRWLSVARHPSIGGAVGDLLTWAGCRIRDRVEERSWWTFREFERYTNLEPSLDRAVTAGVVTCRGVDTWLAKQRQRAADGEFRAEMVKVLGGYRPLMWLGCCSSCSRLP